MEKIEAERARKRNAAHAERLKRHAIVNPSLLASYNSYGDPEFVSRGYYLDVDFACIDCGAKETWTATQQKWWYEVAKGDVFSTAIRCRSCRRKERLRINEARKIHLDGLEKKAKNSNVRKSGTRTAAK